MLDLAALGQGCRVQHQGQGRHHTALVCQMAPGDASSHYRQRAAHRDAPGLAASHTLHCALFPFCPQPIGLFPPFGAPARSFHFVGIRLCLENTGSSLAPVHFYLG